MKLSRILSGVAAIVAAGSALAHEGPVPVNVPQIDHVFLIMMENHIYGQILSNPNAPFINKLAQKANLATNYFAVGHPSLTNYLETVGGSNFGIRSDAYPDWHDASCQPNLATKVTALDNPSNTGPGICPIHGKGTDAATPVIDFTNETTDPAGECQIDCTQSIPAATNITGKTIAQQLVSVGKSWKTYQEDLPLDGPDRINYSDGFFSNLTDFTKIQPQLSPPLTQSDIVYRYAVKHNPFVYFRNIQLGTDPAESFMHVQPFSGQKGLYASLKKGNLPTFAFIAPEQCNDQHGRGNAGAFCNYDPDDNGTQAGLNPALIIQGDQTVERIVTEIKASPVWTNSRSAIVLMWDENDYSLSPNKNQVVVVVDTNYGKHGVQSNVRYTHFSMLKTLEGAFGLPCLNHACDAGVVAMRDLFE